VSAAPAQDFAVLRRIDPRFDAVAKEIRIRADPILRDPATVAVGRDAVWVGTDWGLLERVDPSLSAVPKPVDTGNSPTAIAVDVDAVWVVDAAANNVVRVDPATNLASISPIPVGNGPSAVADGEGAIWVVDRDDDTVVRIDPDTSVTDEIPVGRSPMGIAVDYGGVWVANSGDGTVSRIDPKTNGVTTIPVGGSPQRIAAGGGRVWVTVQSVVLRLTTARTGGAFRTNSESPIESLDPALVDQFSVAWSIEYATCAKLLNYPDRPAPAGSRLEPEVAAGLPTRSADGKTYTFTIRPGFRFSPPSNEAVTARTFQYTIERALLADNPYLDDVVGAKAYKAGKAERVSGVSARGNRLTIKLTRPARDFVARIALPQFCPVPVGTPPTGVRKIPSAGPYYVVSYVPREGAVLKRNPNYRGSRPHHLQKIVYSVGVSKAQTLKEVENGDADFAADGVPSQEVERLARRYGPGSPAAKAGRQRFFVNPGSPPLATSWLALNTSRPLFSDAKVRRAVNYALDREAIARIGAFTTERGTPTDQLLPPGIPGFRDARIYPFTPDLPKARMLARGKGGKGALYTCTTPQCRQAAQIVQADLKAIGIDLEVKYFTVGAVFERVARRGEPFDAAIVGWVADYADPGYVLNVLYGPSIGANSFWSNSNSSYFDDPSYNRRLRTAAGLSGARRYSAYAALDADLARRAAPFAALFNASEFDFFSARMGCQVYQPVYGVDLAALCIRGKG
jgi:peptide/nickel transport system substrate-binding protein